jgi:hypothetical protein
MGGGEEEEASDVSLLLYQSFSQPCITAAARLVVFTADAAALRWVTSCTITSFPLLPDCWSEATTGYCA